MIEIKRAYGVDSSVPCLSCSAIFQPRPGNNDRHVRPGQTPGRGSQKRCERDRKDDGDARSNPPLISFCTPLRDHVSDLIVYPKVCVGQETGPGGPAGPAAGLGTLRYLFGDLRSAERDPAAMTGMSQPKKEP